MSKMTSAGVILGIFLISLAIFRGGNFLIFFNLDAAFITIGGTFAATLIAYPFTDIKRLSIVALNAFKEEVYPPARFIVTILNLSKVYRVKGLKKLETNEESLDNRYLRLGVELIVDGYDESDIETIMEKERLFLSLRHESGESIIRTMARFAPAFGMVGTLIGLIQVMMNLSAPETVGPPLATALVSTFYGIIAANLLFLPLSAKLRTRTDRELLMMRLIKEGVLGIFRKDNPGVLKRHLNSILPPAQRIR